MDDLVSNLSQCSVYDLGLYGKSEFDKAKADMIADCFEDFFKPLEKIFRGSEGDEEKVGRRNNAVWNIQWKTVQDMRLISVYQVGQCFSKYVYMVFSYHIVQFELGPMQTNNGTRYLALFVGLCVYSFIAFCFCHKRLNTRATVSVYR